MALITKTDKAKTYFPLIQNSLTEDDLDKMEAMTRWGRIEFIIDRFQSMKLDEIKAERSKLKLTTSRESRRVIQRNIITLMGELQGKEQGRTLIR